MNKITVWSVVNDYKITFNHIENGWVDGEYPLPKKPEHTNQLAWAKTEWEKKFGYLNEKGEVVKC